VIVIVMGVAGSGKTTIGRQLAAALGCRFLEGDALHSADSLAAMQRGVALTDAERGPWLDAVHAELQHAARAGESLVVACSALKAAYRRRLGEGLHPRWVFLTGPEALIRERLARRPDHFFPAGLLDSQLADLEPPSHALVVDVSPPPAAIVERILAALGVDPAAGRVAPRIFPDVDSLVRDAAAACATAMAAAVRARGSCSVALSGGSTPIPLHRLLATAFRDQVPWDRVHVFWGDERYVPHGDARSNYRMARETLLDHVPVPAAQVHPMPTHFADPHDAAADYERTLRTFLNDPVRPLDLAIMGMGPDGHTASLFPHAAALGDTTRWVTAVTGSADPPTRLTLTIPPLAAAHAVYFLVTGADKAEPVQQVLSGTADPDRYPAAALQRAAPHATWWLDAAAAAHLTHSPRD
jgi:6-phosphogluconolactonase